MTSAISNNEVSSNAWMSSELKIRPRSWMKRCAALPFNARTVSSAEVIDSFVLKMPRFWLRVFPSSSRICQALSGPVLTSRWHPGLLSVLSVPSETARGVTCRTYSPARWPARRPKTIVSNRELPPSRLAPCTLTHAHSPAAYKPPGISVSPHWSRSYAPHLIMRSRTHWNGALNRIDTGKFDGQFANLGEPLHDPLTP